MRAILISPWDRTITEVDHNGDFREIYSFLSAPQRKVETFDLLRIEANAYIYLDGEGFLAENIPVWYWMNYPNPLAGNGLILGSDEEGDSVAYDGSLVSVQRQVFWSPKVSEGRLHGAGMVNAYTYSLGQPVIKDKP